MADARDFRESIAQGDDIGLQGVVASLRNWLMVHLMTTDAVMEAFLSRVAREQSAATAGAPVSVSGD